jgi:hypothetical protein
LSCPRASFAFTSMRPHESGRHTQLRYLHAHDSSRLSSRPGSWGVCRAKAFAIKPGKQREHQGLRCRALDTLVRGAAASPACAPGGHRAEQYVAILAQPAGVKPTTVM